MITQWGVSTSPHCVGQYIPTSLFSWMDVHSSWRAKTTSPCMYVQFFMKSQALLRRCMDVVQLFSLDGYTFLMKSWALLLGWMDGWMHILQEQLSQACNSPWMMYVHWSWNRPLLRGWMYLLSWRPQQSPCTWMDVWMDDINYSSMNDSERDGNGTMWEWGAWRCCDAFVCVCVCVCVFVAGHHRRRHPHHDPPPSELFALKRDSRAFDCIFPRCAHSAQLLHASFTSFQSPFGPQ